jgi:hypothetical protein
LPSSTSPGKPYSLGARLPSVAKSRTKGPRRIAAGACAPGRLGRAGDGAGCRAAVDDQAVSGDETSGVADEDERRLGDVLGLTGHGQRLGVHQCGVRRRLVEVRAPAKDRSRDAAGGDAVDANPVDGELDRGRAGEVRHAGLGRAVGVQVRIAVDAGDRGGGDDGAAALRAHRRDGVLDAEEDAAQANGLGAVPVFDRNAFQWAQGAADAGVVEHHVEAAKFVERPRHQGLDVRLGGDVGSLEDAPWPRLAGALRRRLATRPIQIRQHDVGAFAGEERRRRLAHAARRAGDHRRLPVQLPHGVFRFPRRARRLAAPRSRSIYFKPRGGGMTSRSRWTNLA